MSEETTVVNAEQQAAPVVDNITQHFQNSIWGEGNQLPKPVDNSQPENTDKATQPPENEIAVPVDWLKKEFEIEDPAILKAGMEELKTLKAIPPKAEEIKFADEQSKQIYELLREGGDKKKEVLQILKTQEQIETIASLDVNKNNAEDIIKLQIKLKNPQLSKEDIDFEYSQNYGIPKEPVQRKLEEDDEFEERMGEWRDKVAMMERKREVSAKIAQPELLKFKSELVLPPINKGTTANQNQPTPEEKAEFDKAKESFLQSAKQTVDGFSGFATQVKDKDVDYSVSYAPSTEEKKLLSDNLTRLAESGFDANTLFAERWYDVNTKTFKIDQMTKDLSRIFIGENSDKKLAADAANKRLETYLAEKKNVKFSQGNEGSTFNPDTKTKSEKLAEQFFGSN